MTGSFTSRPLRSGTTGSSKELLPLPQYPPVIRVERLASALFALIGVRSAHWFAPVIHQVQGLDGVHKADTQQPLAAWLPQKTVGALPCPEGSYQTLWLVVSNRRWLTSGAHQSTCNLKRGHVEGRGGDQSNLVGVIQPLRWFTASA